MSMDLPEFMEDTVGLAVDDWFRRYDAMAKGITRIPWTRKMTKRERFSMAMDMQMRGAQGWGQFLSDLIGGGMTYEQALREITELSVEFNTALARDGMDAPHVEMEEADAWELGI